VLAARRVGVGEGRIFFIRVDEQGETTREIAAFRDVVAGAGGACRACGDARGAGDSWMCAGTGRGSVESSYFDGGGAGLRGCGITVRSMGIRAITSLAGERGGVGGVGGSDGLVAGGGGGGVRVS